MKNYSLLLLLLLFIDVIAIDAQVFKWISSTEDNTWEETTVKLKNTLDTNEVIEIDANEEISTFKSWGTCFNEKGWDALNMLPSEQQDKILSNLFSPQGDLRFNMGRFSMNANDYARDWYSCDEVSGDFQLHYFNIDRDRTSLIPYIKAAQSFNPELTFWISPWSPPSWMKINHYYSVVSNERFNDLDPKLNYLLYEDTKMLDEKVFPKQVAINDYLIQDPRYLQTYANYFSKFISAYQAEGIPIKTVMFQNEPWSYTPYPGCAWTPKGIINFNAEYLAPTLKKDHPEVAVYFGTINSNRYDAVDEVLSDSRAIKTFQGVGFQWEGGQILPRVREKFPNFTYVQTESECGWGSFDWGAAEHTFGLINHYLGNGCVEYTFWNAVLYDEGISGWGWKQNALIRVDSEKKIATYTPEYYAVKHYTHFISNGSKVVSYIPGKEEKLPIIIVKNTEDKYIIISGNFNEESKEISIKLGGKYLNVTLKPHSLNTFQLK